MKNRINGIKAITIIMNLLYYFVFFKIFYPIYTPTAPVTGIIATKKEVSLDVNPNGKTKNEIFTINPPVIEPRHNAAPATK